MNVVNKIKMDMTKPDLSLSVNAVQGDAYSRTLNIALYNGIQPWIIPEDVRAAIRYAKPDHTKGYYDIMPDGTSAWSIQNNLLTIQLAPQMLTVAGNVKAQIELIQGTHILSTFCLQIHVEANPANGVLKSEDYINWLQWLQNQSAEQVSLVRQSAEAALQAAGRAVEAAASASSSQKETASIAAEVSAIVAGNESYTKKESNARYSPAISQSVTGEFLTLSGSASAAFLGLKFFGKTVRNGTPSPDAPVSLVSLGDSGSVTATVCRKNLLLNTAATLTTNGITFSVHEDGSVTVNGTATDTAYLNLDFTGKTLDAGNTYTASLVDQAVNGLVMGAGYFQTNGAVFSIPVTTLQNFTVSNDYLQNRTFLYVEAGKTIHNVTVYPMVHLASDADSTYEPYSETSITVSTRNGLPGIPVSAGGNYTDENGQQWLCDEVDFADGTYVQRVNRVIFDGSADELWTSAANGLAFCHLANPLVPKNNNLYGALLCDHCNTVSGNELLTETTMTGICMLEEGTLGIRIDPSHTMDNLLSWLNRNPVTVLYALAEPASTRLSPEEQESYADLYTCYPNTTLFNNVQMCMEAKYVADTKRYIDCQIKQLLVNSL